MGPFIHFKMYKLVAFVLSFTVIATYGFNLKANEASTREEGCIVPSWRGDNYCDDGNNNKGCGYDGGDCCGSNANKTYCQKCQCLDPNNKGLKCNEEGTIGFWNSQDSCICKVNIIGRFCDRCSYGLTGFPDCIGDMTVLVVNGFPRDGR